MADTEEKKKVSFSLSEGILLATAPTFAYLFTFYYEKGYTSYFGIPEQFISINLINVLIFAAAFLSAFILLFPLMNLLVMTLWNINSTILMSIAKTIAALIFLAILIILFGPMGWKYWVWAVIIVVAYATFDLIFPLVTQRDKKGYIEKLRAQEDREKKVKGILDIVPIRHRLGIYLMLALLVFGIIIAEQMGKAEAFKQTEFLVTNTSQEMVVLRIYGDNLICVPFSRNTNEVEKKFAVIKMADTPNLSLNLEKIGPLHPVTP
jgi:hypothetical protein